MRKELASIAFAVILLHLAQPAAASSRGDYLKSAMLRAGDINNDGVINGYDWHKIDPQNQMYIIKTYQELYIRDRGINPSMRGMGSLVLKQAFSLLSSIDAIYTNRANWDTNVFILEHELLDEAFR